MLSGVESCGEWGGIIQCELLSAKKPLFFKDVLKIIYNIKIRFSILNFRCFLLNLRMFLPQGCIPLFCVLLSLN